MKNISHLENKIELRDCVIDFEELKKSDFDNGIRLKIFSDPAHLVLCERNVETEENIFNLWIEFGEDWGKTIMSDVPIDQLELFAYSVLKHIKIVQKLYGKDIKVQYRMGGNC